MNISKRKLENMFKKESVLTLEEIGEKFKITKASAKYHVKKIGGISSLNENNKYYSLPHIIEHNSDGFWEYNGIKFSSLGNLNKTLISKIEESAEGMIAKNLEELFSVKLSSILSSLTLKEKVQREKINSVFVYFSINEERFEIQKNKKLSSVLTENNILNLGYIYALIERMKNPDLGAKEFAKTITSKGFTVNPLDIENFFNYHNITKGEIIYSEIILLRELWDKVKDKMNLDIKLDYEPVVLFDANTEKSECCGSPVTPYKTNDKSVSILDIGSVSAYEKQVHCLECKTVYKSQELLKVVPPNANNSYELIEFIGREMYQKNSQAREVSVELSKRHINMSISEIEVLAKKFVIYLSQWHKENSSKIIEFMDNNGGYILHLDALGGTGGKRVMSGIDGISNIVLANEKIDSEHSDSIIPFLEKIKEQFGEPLRVVQDMGKGIMKAVRHVFPNIIILICHFHFLRDLGKDLLNEDNDILRAQLRKFNIRVKIKKLLKDIKLIYENNDKEFQEKLLKLYSLLAWLNDWKSESNGYGFPFDRPYYDLHNRIKRAFKIIKTIQIPEKEFSENDLCDIIKIKNTFTEILTDIVNDKISKKTIFEMNKNIVIFDSLREAMRIASVTGKKGLNEEENVDIKTIKSTVECFIEDQKFNNTFMESDKGQKFFTQINKYKEQLFSDPITIKTDKEEKIIQPQRTNNIMEQSFREFTRHIKRKTGDDSVGRTIQGMIADTPLVKNLDNKEYIKIMMNGKKSLAEVFSEIDIKVIRNEMLKFKLTTSKLPDAINKILKKDQAIELLIKEL